MHRMTDHRCSLVVDRAERKRFQEKSAARMAAIESPLKIVEPRKAPADNKRALLRKAQEQVRACACVCVQK
jgi:hypothetical protein